MSKNKYTIWEFIKYIFSFWFHRRKMKREERKNEFKKVADDLQSEFKNIDDNKEDKKQGNLEKRLNNMFD